MIHQEITIDPKPLGPALVGHFQINVIGDEGTRVLPGLTWRSKSMLSFDRGGVRAENWIGEISEFTKLTNTTDL